MSSEEDKKMKELLEKLKLGKYLQNFIEEDIIYSDIEDMVENEVEELIPKSVHRRRFLKFIKSLKEGGGDEKEGSTKNEASKVTVEVLVKWGKLIEKVYDVPLDYSNEMLIGKLLQAFLKCEVKLQGEKRALAKELKSFQLKDWCEEREGSLDDTIRAVLSVKGEVLEAQQEDEGSREKEEELKEELEKVMEAHRVEKENWLNEKKEKTRMEAEAKEMVKTLQAENSKLRAEIKKLKAGPDGTKKIAKSSSTFIKRYGIYIPNPSSLKFIKNEFLDAGNVSLLNNFKMARQTTDREYENRCTFKANVKFVSGKKYYFQVKATAKCRGWGACEAGVLNGKVKAIARLYEHDKGWAYDLALLPTKGYMAANNNVVHRKYGPIPRKEDSVIGVLVDFTLEGKGKVSFIVDGKNYGVAFHDVEPPVSPAFCMSRKDECFELCQDYDIPQSLMKMN